MKYIAAIVPNNFKHKAGDGLSTRSHHLKKIHPALQANSGSTQATYILYGDEEFINEYRIKINE